MDKIALLKKKKEALEASIMSEQLLLAEMHKIGENCKVMEQVAIMAIKQISFAESRINVINQGITILDNQAKGIYSKRQQKKITKQNLAS